MAAAPVAVPPWPLTAPAQTIFGSPELPAAWQDRSNYYIVLLRLTSRLNTPGLCQHQGAAHRFPLHRWHFAPPRPPKSPATIVWPVPSLPSLAPAVPHRAPPQSAARIPLGTVPILPLRYSLTLFG